MGGVGSAIASLPFVGGRSPLPIRDEPLRFRTYAFEDCAAEASAITGTLDTVRHRLRLRRDMSFSDLLHWLHVFGSPNSPEFQSDGADEVISLLTDTHQLERRFDQSGVIVQTPNGIRYLSRLAGLELKRDSRPAHPYQELAIFGEIGLGASTPITVSADAFRLRDAINDCLANLQIREASRQEPEWPTQVLLHYLLPESSWRNRWGEELTLERWIAFLIQRDLTRYSCSGTHLLHALALALQAHSQHPIMSRSLCQEVQCVCRDASRKLESTLHSDGAWRRDWAGGDAEEYEGAGIHLTGHILEAQLFLPPDLQVAPSAVKAGLRYITQSFARATNEQVVESYCQYSHAGNALLRFASCSPSATLST